MRVLAIDTALAACAAAVLDTDHGVVASETLPMVRGHAESLIPLTARLADKDSQNTLTPADLAAPWRGPAPRKDARRKPGAIVQASPPRGDIDLRGVALYIKADASDQRSSLDTMADIDEIIGNFAVLDDWDDRYRYLIELGRELPPLAAAAHSDANKVQGCASQVWLDTTVRPNGAGGPVLTFAGDSDAHIVRGLIAILFAVYSGKSARKILNTDAVKLFEGMGLREHLTPQRSNGFRSMVERIRSDARAAFAAAA